MSKSSYEHPFVRHLIADIGPDRAARAALRRTLGRAPGEAPDAFRYVVPWLPQPCGERAERIYYLIAGLYAYHPKHTPEGNLGGHLRELAGADKDALERLEKRLQAALRVHPDDLPDHLRRLVGIFKAKEKPLNWHALIGDLLSWEHDDRYAQKRWAQAFWGGKTNPEPTAAPDAGDSIDSFVSEKE